MSENQSGENSPVSAYRPLARSVATLSVQIIALTRDCENASPETRALILEQIRDIAAIQGHTCDSLLEIDFPDLVVIGTGSWPSKSGGKA